MTCLFEHKQKLQYIPVDIIDFHGALYGDVGGSDGGLWNNEGLIFASHRLKEMGIGTENKAWENNNFVRGTYFHDLTTSTAKVVSSSIDV